MKLGRSGVEKTPPPLEATRVAHLRNEFLAVRRRFSALFPDEARILLRIMIIFLLRTNADGER